jgi:anthranilate phosphoribosyltransferase
MRFVDAIARKRDGNALSRSEIDAFVAGVTDGSIPDYQASALLMAIVLRGMSDAGNRLAHRCDGAVRAIAWTFPTFPASRSASTALEALATRSR